MAGPITRRAAPAALSTQAPSRAAADTVRTVSSTIVPGRAARASSSRSPTIVRRGRSSHRGTQISIARPRSHSRSPAVRATAPMAPRSTATEAARRWRRTWTAHRTRAPRSASTRPAGPGTPATRASQPVALPAGARRAQSARAAMARSSATTVPRRPTSTRGPWKATSSASSTGARAPGLSRTASSPARRHAPPAPRMMSPGTSRDAPGRDRVGGTDARGARAEAAERGSPDTLTSLFSTPSTVIK